MGHHAAPLTTAEVTPKFMLWLPVEHTMLCWQPFCECCRTDGSVIALLTNLTGPDSGVLGWAVGDGLGRERRTDIKWGERESGILEGVNVATAVYTGT